MLFVIIHKFGGSCLRDETGLTRLIEILENESTPVVITLSASFGITKYLQNLLETPVNQIDIPKTIEYLRNYHVKLLSIYKGKTPWLDKELEKLERLLFGVAYTEEITPRVRDLILSFGERLIVKVVKKYLDLQKINSQILVPEEIITTNGVFGTSTILLENTKENCQTFLRKHPDLNMVLIMPGYYGASKENVVNLLGGSGTDYSATAIGYGFEAEKIIIWKDVLGFMTADPNIIKEASTLETLSYEEAAELSHFGAQILHSRSVIPAKLKNIPIFIKHLHDSEIQTKIWNHESLRSGDVVKGVSYLENLAILRIYTTLGSNIEGVFNKITEKLQEVGTNIVSVATSQTCISVLIEKKQINTSLEKLQYLQPHIIDEVECQNNIALIGIVGFGLGDTPGIASRVFNAVAKINVNVEMISSGASKAAYHLTVKQQDLKSALRIIHQEFFTLQPIRG